MCPNEWDRDVNLTEEQLEEEHAQETLRQWESHPLHREADRAAQRRELGYFDIPYIPNHEVTRRFPHYDREEFHRNDAHIGPWSVNKVWWICQDCGSMGFKQGEVSELFKCYNYWCRSRNVTIARAGDIATLIHEHPIGIKMEDKYAERRERLRRQRAERASQRR